MVAGGEMAGFCFSSKVENFTLATPLNLSFSGYLKKRELEGLKNTNISNQLQEET